MACVLTTGFNLDCRKSIGGIRTIWVTELENVDTLTVASGSVSALTLDSGKYLWKYELRPGSSEAKAENQGDVAAGSGYLKHMVQIQGGKMDVSYLNEIRKLAQKPLLFVVKDENDVLLVYGAYKGLDLTTGTAQSGKAGNDLNGFTLTFEGNELEYPLGISQAIVNSLVSP